MLGLGCAGFGSCRDRRVGLRIGVLECLDRRRHRERRGSPSRRRRWHPRLLSGRGRNRGRRGVARNSRRTTSGLLRPGRRLGGARRRGRRGPLAGWRRRLCSGPLLQRCTSLGCGGLRRRSLRTRSLRRPGLRTRRHHRLWNRGLGARHLLNSRNSQVALRPVGLLTKTQPREQRLLALLRCRRIPHGYRT